MKSASRRRPSAASCEPSRPNLPNGARLKSGTSQRQHAAESEGSQWVPARTPGGLCSLSNGRSAACSPVGAFACARLGSPSTAVDLSRGGPRVTGGFYLIDTQMRPFVRVTLGDQAVRTEVERVFDSRAMRISVEFWLALAPSRPAACTRCPARKRFCPLWSGHGLHSRAARAGRGVPHRRALSLLTGSPAMHRRHSRAPLTRRPVFPDTAG